MKRQITLVSLCFAAALAAGCANRTGTMGGPGGYSAGSQPDSPGATAAPIGRTTPSTGTPPGSITRTAP
jgi:hypothetical protein